MNGYRFSRYYYVGFASLSGVPLIGALSSWWSGEKHERFIYEKEPAKKRIAIIGGGIGGTSCAYWIHKTAGDAVQIDLYNVGKIGGRIAAVEMNGKMYEAGASILHPENLYMKRWAEEFGFKKRDKPPNLRMGIYDGFKFVFTFGSSWPFVDYFKLICHYGYDPIRLKYFIEDMLKKFGKIYELQDQGHAYETVEDLLLAMDKEFPKQMNGRFPSWLKTKAAFGAKFVNELAAAAINCNYGQSIYDINAFVGSVGLAGAAPNLWAVEGGNFRIPEKLVEESKAKIIESKVTNVTKDPSGQFLVETLDESKRLHNTLGLYDTVIVAIPLNTLNPSLTIDGVDLGAHSGPYQQIRAIFVHGKLRAEEFSQNPKDLPDEILINNPTMAIKSIGKNFPVDWTKKDPNSEVYKIFSDRPLSEKKLKNLFEEIHEVKEIVWYAYPNYEIKEVAKNHNFKLSRGVYHVNAIEWAASAMEMSAIGGRNVANLVLKDLGIVP